MDEVPDFVVIPCLACDATTIALADQRRPLMCARCRAPYDVASRSFSRSPGTSLDAPEPRMPSDVPPQVM